MQHMQHTSRMFSKITKICRLRKKIQQKSGPKERCFIQDDVQTGNKQMKRCSAYLAKGRREKAHPSKVRMTIMGTLCVTKGTLHATVESTTWLKCPGKLAQWSSLGTHGALAVSPALYMPKQRSAYVYQQDHLEHSLGHCCISP